MKYLLFLAITAAASICLSRDIRIAVIDAGLDNTKGIKLCADPIDLIKTRVVSEFNHHGDNVTHIIADGLKNYCVISIKAFSEIKHDKLSDAINEAIKQKPDIINISGGGTDALDRERLAVNAAISKGIVIIASAGNNKSDLDKNCNYYPACYPGVVIIGNIYPSSNHGKIVNYWMKGVNITAGGVTMTGTSQAAAMYTHKLALEYKYK